MKRSEIQLLVANMIRLYRLDNVEDMQAADRLLQVLEQEGMMPPHTNLKDCDDPVFQVYVDNIDIPHWVVLGWDNE
jgi:hypothetical protein